MSKLPLPLQPLKAGDFAYWMAPKAIPTGEIISASPNGASNGNSNTGIYLAIGVLAIGGTILVIHLITENSALKYELQESTGKVQTLSTLYQQELSKNNLLTI